MRRLDEAVAAAAAAAGRLTPLTRQKLRERIGDAVVDCEEGCPRSVARLASAAAHLPWLAVVSVPKGCLAAVAARVLPPDSARPSCSTPATRLRTSRLAPTTPPLRSLATPR